MGNWKAVLGPKKKTKRRQLELYDLSRDIGENNNLPEIAVRMEAIMNQAYTEPRPQREPKSASAERQKVPLSKVASTRSKTCARIGKMGTRSKV